MEKMQFSIKKLENEAVETPVYFDEMVDISNLALSKSNDIRQIGKVQVKGFVVAEKAEFIFSFTVTGKMVLPCARTLADVDYPFEYKGDEFFSTADIVPDDDEDEVHHVQGELIDLTPYIKENIILQMTYLVFSEEKGLQSGSGWELHDEESFNREQSEQIDPRLAKLQQLIDTDKDNK